MRAIAGQEEAIMKAFIYISCMEPGEGVRRKTTKRKSTNPTLCGQKEKERVRVGERVEITGERHEAVGLNRRRNLRA